MNYNNPAEPSLWTEEHKADFLRRASEAYGQLVQELGSKYIIVNNVEQIHFIF